MVEKRWNLRDVLPEVNSKEYKLLLEDLEKNVKFIESFRGKLNSSISIKDFMNIMNNNK